MLITGQAPFLVHDKKSIGLLFWTLSNISLYLGTIEESVVFYKICAYLYMGLFLNVNYNKYPARYHISSWKNLEGTQSLRLVSWQWITTWVKHIFKLRRKKVEVLYKLPFIFLVWIDIISTEPPLKKEKKNTLVCL